MSVDDKLVNVKALKAGLDTKCSVYRFTATVPTTGWTEYQSSGVYYVSVAVNGILSTDNGGAVDLVQSGTETTDKQLRTMYSKFTRVTTANNSITVYAEAIPTMAIPIRMEVFR